MRITFIAFGTRGDVQPAITLGNGLAARGHRVRVVAGADFGPSAVDLIEASRRG